MKRFNEEKFLKVLQRWGYDEDFYSIRSSVFIVSLHTELPIKVTVEDAIVTDLNERAWDMFIDYSIKNNPEMMKTIKKNDKYSLFRMDHDQTYACSYLFLNKTEKELTVKIDISSSTNCYFWPDDG